MGWGSTKQSPPSPIPYRLRDEESKQHSRQASRLCEDGEEFSATRDFVLFVFNIETGLLDICVLSWFYGRFRKTIGAALTTTIKS